MQAEQHHPWDGPKTERLSIRVTKAEKAELIKVANANGGQSLSRYLLCLHHVKMGRIPEGSK